MYDLRYESWIPFRRRSGRVEWGAPSLLTSDLLTDPVVALASPRPDFDGALTEFLIGLLTVAFELDDERDWGVQWSTPPTPAAIRDRLDALPAAFYLDGDGPRFLQDASPADLNGAKSVPIQQMLLDAPGDQAVEFNTDLFVKRDQVAQLSRATAAMALLTLQTYASSGGKGYRTSLRGGGPLTTIVDPREAGQPLWHLLWANVESAEQWQRRNDGRLEKTPELVFPWLARTRISEPNVGAATTPSDGHALQCYFGMPRRIRLEFNGGGTCSLTNQPDNVTVPSFRRRTYGVQYSAWHHPLTPYYLSKDGSWLPVHGQPGGVGWKDWLGVVMAVKDGSRRPAQVVEHFNRRRSGQNGSTVGRVSVFGYDFDNMKARDWIESSLPVVSAYAEDSRESIESLADGLTNGTGIAATALHSAVLAALFDRGDDAKGDWSHVKGALWNAMEQPFYSALQRTVASPDAESVFRERTVFRALLESAALHGFDQNAPADSATPQAMRRRVNARFSLSMTVRGFSKLGAKLFSSLQIPAPQTAPRRASTRKGKEQQA